MEWKEGARVYVCVGGGGSGRMILSLSTCIDVCVDSYI